MWLVFTAMAVMSVFIAIGLFYRFSSLAFFLLFTYVELLDVSNYLNHYYFISIFSLLMALMPAGRRLSVDVRLWPQMAQHTVPFWIIGALRAQLGMVYFFAGVAKLNYDWLFRAQPLQTWFVPFTQLSLVGKIFEWKMTAYLFSWAGAFYDLTVPFLLSFRKTLPFAYLAVVGFHIITGLMFPIGMFPWVMIVLTWIFFPIELHEAIVSKIERLLRFKSGVLIPWNPQWRRIFACGIMLHLLIQVVLPFRYLLYPGKLFWTEEGFRFSWRVMLMEKAASAQFYVSDPETGRTWDIHNPHYLTPVQEKQMSSQPDLILQFAHILDNEFRSIGVKDPVVTADVFVALNGRRSKRYFENTLDLSLLEDGFAHKDWIIDYEDL
jgi:hypothetical protein